MICILLYRFQIQEQQHHPVPNNLGSLYFRSFDVPVTGFPAVSEINFITPRPMISRLENASPRPISPRNLKKSRYCATNPNIPSRYYRTATYWGTRIPPFTSFRDLKRSHIIQVIRIDAGFLNYHICSPMSMIASLLEKHPPYLPV